MPTPAVVSWASRFRRRGFRSAVKSDKIQGADGGDSSDVAARNPLATVAHGQTLAEAIVDTVREPLVVLDHDLRVIAASRSFYRTFAVAPQDTQGRRLYELGDGQWNIPALRTVLEEIIPRQRTVEAYEVEHEFPTIGRRVMLLNARQVLGEDGSSTALLLAIEDVTERRDAEREKDELLRQKEVLLQEMQHRVANSLQIIASILLLKARTVQSEEIREHLRDAHQRVMSVATVQQQLHASGLNESINIGSYLSKLCESLAKSMVGERRPVSLKVEATAGAAVSDVAVSLGLIVTELVINALKHAFPSGEEGEILVKYEAENSGWKLSVCDNGSGPNETPGEPPHTGLGTSIVEALAHQLNATVQKASGNWGTTVTIAVRRQAPGSNDCRRRSAKIS
jgi:PAS domain S-box-containing protein